MTMNLSEITEKLQSKKNIFITGGAGVGKSTLTRRIIAAFESEGKKVAKLASTGMAATLIGGQTLHSFFDFGICDSLEELERQRKFEPKRKIVRLVRSMELIVIDEISMVSAPLLDMIRLRLLQCDFTGAVLVVGDFLQLPPIARGTTRAAFAFESQSWERFAFETVLLTQVWRSDDERFIEVLDAIRYSRVGDAEHRYLHELIKPLGEDLSRYTFLYGTNASAKAHNEAQLAHIQSEEVRFEAGVTLHDMKVQERDVERFFDDARIDRVLRLKVGAPVLFTKNAWNYFNGERGVLERFEEGVIHVRKSDGTLIKLERVTTQKTRWVERTRSGKKEFVEEPLFSVEHYPIRLAFAITIHKSQGMSIADLVIDTREIFAPSQFYVAISRAVSPQRLTLIQPLRDWKYLAFVDSEALRFVERLQAQSRACECVED